ncbi:hypothetical protein [Agrobacterium tumefaciens]|uniref:hypothetical protein n=1 Tax=Agrobacterium tumefaciens TaxID=358 RepID=UPI001FF050F0|nr:hypothetical protein [Agrobacterium tumefaciens]
MSSKLRQTQNWTPITPPEGSIFHAETHRAITQSAFTISLLQYCADNDLAHPGIVVLDSPLLSYREPDGADDDLSETNLNGNFYRYLLSLQSDRQAIIVENMDPPSDVELGDRVIHFSGMVDEDRFGLFPRQ